MDNLLRIFIEERGLGVLYRKCVAVRLSSRNVFLPDLVYLTPEQQARTGDTYIPFAPTLVVEALSPNTAERDIGPKFAAYEEHGVNEYWILDPETHAHRFYAREGEILVEFAETGDTIRSKYLPGLALPRQWLTPPFPKLRGAGARLLGNHPHD
ncbi:MAG: Uma2 family endonuclease [Opitutales bacterium]|nr:Uma2 family endonuclease [Opitutales bacterium]